MLLPDRTPPVQELPIELLVLNVPGQGTSISNYDSVLVVDSAAPEVVFDQFVFPTSSLLRLESDRLEVSKLTFKSMIRVVCLKTM